MGSCRFGKFKADKAGYAALMNGAEVQSAVDRCADAVKARANASLSPGGYDYEDFEKCEFQGKLAKGRVVRTKTDHARYSNAKNNTLLKSLGG